MIKHRIRYEVKKDRVVIELVKDFANFSDACTFIREIKGSCASKPIIEEINTQKFNFRKV
jgi:hypothetical protein